MQLTTKKRTNGHITVQPTSMITKIRRDMDELFDRFLEGGIEWPVLRTGGAWTPTIDFSESEKEFTLRAEIPGVDPKDVDVSVSGDILTITGEKSESLERQEDNCYISERRFGSFRRMIDLPPSADPDKVNAKYDNGILTVTIGKLKVAEPKHIPIGKGA